MCHGMYTAVIRSCCLVQHIPSYHTNAYIIIIAFFDLFVAFGCDTFNVSVVHTLSMFVDSVGHCYVM